MEVTLEQALSSARARHNSLGDAARSSGSGSRWRSGHHRVLANPAEGLGQRV